MRDLELNPKLQEVVNNLLEQFKDESCVVEAHETWAVVSTKDIVIDIEVTQ